MFVKERSRINIKNNRFETTISPHFIIFDYYTLMDHISTSPISVLLPIYRHGLIISQKKSISFIIYYFTDSKLEIDFGDGKPSYITNKGQCLVINKHCYVFNNPEEKEYFMKTQTVKMDRFQLPKQKEVVSEGSVLENSKTMTVSLSKRSKPSKKVSKKCLLYQ